MNKSLSELQAEASRCGFLTDGFTKEMIMDMLAPYYRNIRVHERHGDAPLLKQVPAMLARNVKDLTQEQFQTLLVAPDIVAEEKYDGCRTKLHIGKYCNRIDSRHRCTDTYEYNERTANFPHLSNLSCPSLEGTIIDGEMKMPVNSMSDGKTQTTDELTTTASVFNSSAVRAVELQKKFGLCEFIAFDVPFYKGEDIRKESFRVRRMRLNILYTSHFRLKSFFHTAPTHRPYHSNARDFFTAFHDKVLAKGGEGIMLKDLRMPYAQKEGQRTKAMYKWKQHHFIYCFVTGFIPGQGEFDGMIGSLLISVNDRNGTTHEIGAIQPGTIPVREAMSTGGVLEDAYYMKVVKVRYQCQTKNKRLRHATLVKFCPEKKFDECIVDGF